MIGYFARHPTAANLLMLAIVLLGVVGMLSMTRAVFPEFESEFVHVRVVYKGASAEEVEETICQRIEDEIEGIEGVERVTSTAREGVGQVSIEVADGFSQLDVYADVDNEIGQIDNFPEQSETPLVWQEQRVDSVIRLSLAGEMPPKDLLTLAEQLKDDLLALEHVSLVDIEGFAEHEIRIEVRRDAQLSLGLTIDDVARAIGSQSVDLPAGSVETDEREIKIRVVDQRRWAEDFRDLPVVSSPRGGEIPLRAIARVSDTFEDEWQQATLNGVRCAVLVVTAADGEDIVKSARAVRAYVEQRQATLPAGVELLPWADWSTPVRDRLGMLVKNGMQGFVLVFFTLWLFLNVRLSAWVAAGIPISFLGTLYVLYLGGMTLNMITMFSLILALGLIVDDAIVIGENIFSHRMRGKNAFAAAIDGTREVGVGVIASLLTTVAVFMPLMMMTGNMGKILRVMPLGVIAALAVSLVEAFLIMPSHLGHSLGRLKEPNRFRRTIDTVVTWFTERVYGRALEWCLAHRPVPIAAVVMLLLLAVGQLAGGRLRFQPFPELDGDFLMARVLMPAGTELEQTRSVVRRVEDALTRVNAAFKPRQPDEQDLILCANTTYGSNDAADETGSHAAIISVELLSSDRRNARCDDVLATWREEVGDVADVVSLTFDQMEVTPAGKAIDIQLRGRHLDDLQRASLELQEKLRGYPGVENLMDNLRPGKPEVRVQLRPTARALGFSAASLAQQLRGGFWGHSAQEFQRGSDVLDVKVELHADDRRSLADLDDFQVVSATGHAVPFREVATAEMVRGFSKIQRVDGYRTAEVEADVDTRLGNAAEILADLERVESRGGQSYFDEFLAQHPGVWINFEGQRKETAKTLGSVGGGFLIGLAMVFILLSFVFKSYIQPVVVMSAIPFGLVGAIFGHIVMGIDWTVPSTVGFVSLAGIVVNDSIVLVQFIKLRLAEGAALRAAVLAAGQARFRAVFLTSATTVAGLLPILAERSMQAQILIPVAVSIAFGLAFATVLVLILVPCLYSLMPQGRPAAT